jgi:hypothetical protein
MVDLKDVPDFLNRLQERTDPTLFIPNATFDGSE